MQRNYHTWILIVYALPLSASNSSLTQKPAIIQHIAPSFTLQSSAVQPSASNTPFTQTIVLQASQRRLPQAHAIPSTIYVLAKPYKKSDADNHNNPDCSSSQHEQLRYVPQESFISYAYGYIWH